MRKILKVSIGGPIREVREKDLKKNHVEPL